jgi:hypothetical protein
MRARPDVQASRFQCLFIKRRKPDGDTLQVVIGPSMLRWLLAVLLVIGLLLRGGNQVQLLWNLLLRCIG